MSTPRRWKNFEHVEVSICPVISAHTVAQANMYIECLQEKCMWWNKCKGSEEIAREWIENTRYNRRGKKFLDCPVCHYGENGDVICEVSKVPNYCPNCGQKLVLPVKKEGEKK